MADGNEDLNASFHEMSLEDGGSTCRTPAKKSLSFEKHGLTPDSKKQGIPKSKARKIDQVYRNIKLKHKLLLEVPVDTAVEADMKARIQELEEDMANVWEDLQMALKEEKGNTQNIMRRYRCLAIARENYLTALINGYQQEIAKLQENNDILSSQQKKNRKMN
ncbi:hypothetical protein QZH41_011723 [Actinostola sp. cb2023]|nr:hypothetical protein QZH41_011723 [Actinostola sp. cb2023]